MQITQLSFALRFSCLLHLHIFRLFSFSRRLCLRNHFIMSTLSKSEHKACLSTSSPSSPMPRHRHHSSSLLPAIEEMSPERAPTRQSNEPQTVSSNYRRQINKPLPEPQSPSNDDELLRQRPNNVDYILAFCYMLLYLEVGWLTMFVWRLYSRH